MTKLVKVFLRGLLNDVPLDVLPPEIQLSFETKQQSAEEIAEMTTFCTAMQCDTERYCVSLLSVQRAMLDSVNFQ